MKRFFLKTYLCSFFLFMAFGFGEEMTLKLFKELQSSKTTQTIRDELKDYPFFKESKGFVKVTYPNGASTYSEMASTARVVAKKYIFIEVLVDDGKVRFYNVIGWDEESQKYRCWYVDREDLLEKSDEEILFYSVGERTDKNSFKYVSDMEKNKKEVVTSQFQKNLFTFKSVSTEYIPDSPVQEIVLEGKLLNQVSMYE